MNTRLIIQTSLLLLLISSQSWGQTEEQVDSAWDKRVKTAAAARKAKAEAETAKMNAEMKEQELQRLKKMKRDSEENLDANKTVDRLKEEIKQIEHKLKIIGTVMLKVIQGFLNPGISVTFADDERELRKEALGGNSQPTVVKSLRESFEEKKKELTEELEEKKKQLKKAQDIANKKKLSAADQKKAQQKIDDLDEQIKKKEMEVQQAQDKAKKKAMAATVAEDADRAAYDKFDKLRKAQRKAAEIAQAKENVSKAIKEVQQAAQALKDKKQELTNNNHLANTMAEFFKYLNTMLDFMDEFSKLLGKFDIDSPWENPDFTKAISQGEKMLRAIDRILNDPKSRHMALINERLENFRKRLQNALNQLKAADRRLKELTAVTTGGTTNDRRLALVKPPGKRTTMLKQPYLALSKDRSIHLYAAAENSLDRGQLVELERVAVLISDYQKEAASAPAGVDVIDLAEANLLVELVAEVKQRYDALLAQVSQVDGLDIPAADVIQSTVAVNIEFDSQLNSIVWDAFGDELLQNRVAKPDAGAVVLKGNARNSIGAAPTLTLTLSPPADQLATPEKTVKVNVDESGDFETTLDPGWQPKQLLIGGRDQKTIHLEDPLTAGLPGSPPWRNANLTPQQQQHVLTVFDQFDQWCASQLTGQAHRARPPSEARAIRGWRLLGVIEGSEPPGDQMPSVELFDIPITLADNSLFKIERSAADPGQVVIPSAASKTIVTQADTTAPANVQSFILGEFDGDSTTRRLSTTSLAEQIGVVSVLPVVADSDRVAEAETALLQALQGRITGHIRAVVGAGATIQVDVADLRRIPSGDQTLVISTFEVAATSASNAAVTIDRDRLKNRIANDPQMPIADVMQLRDAQATPSDPFFSSKGSWGEQYHDQWVLRRAGFVTKAGEGVWPDQLKNCTVAVIGSGVDWLHPELSGQMWVNRAEDPYNGIDDDDNGYIDDVFGWNFRDNTNEVLDRGGHDTHVAGVIAARWNKQGIAGANPSARIMSLKVANFLGQADSVAISRAIYYAVNEGARVINISYNGKTPSPLEQHALAYAARRNVLVIVPAGNQAADAAGMALSGNSNVLTVAGVTRKDRRSGFSNFGLPIDISAPAMDVLSLRAQRTDFLLYTGDNPNYEGGVAIVGKDRSLYRASGTSFAAPLVAGAASLILSQRPGLSGQQVRNMLVMSASDLELPGWDLNSGVGLLNTGSALKQSPDSLLLVRITKIAVSRRDGQIVVNVNGDLDATGERVRRTLQFAFGDSPKEADWQTVSRTEQPLGDANLLGTIPASKFSKPGLWSIRVVAEDEQGIKREARGTLMVK